MRLSWPDIKKRASAFAQEFAQAKNEKSEAQTFWIKFFAVFGVESSRVGVFESRVKKLNKRVGFADYFWPGLLLIEHKSLGENLVIAQHQAADYCVNLKEGEHPRYLLVCDFQNFWLKDLSEGTETQFKLKELPQKVSLFGFILGQQSSRIQANDPINDQAVKKLAKLHGALRRDGYKRHPLQLLLVRLLFCMFADKTGLFEPVDRFTDLIERGTSEDGSNVGQVLTQLFDELDTELAERQSKAPGWFKDFPYVNGHLFQEKIRTASFDAEMRDLLLDCCCLDWGRISPAIFGSMFQHIMDDEGIDTQHDLRRELGAHYTSEDNILKLIGPMFLEELRSEFEKSRGSINKLFEFQKKLRKLSFLDPACGCGNFLVITYRELRLLEIEVFKAVKAVASSGPKGISGLAALDTFRKEMLDVDQFFGMEVEEFPARVAQVAMWLVDHQMNVLAGETLEAWIPRLPLKKSANIRIGDALAQNWADFFPPEHAHFILGNPPFVGKQMQSEGQKASMERLLAGAGISGGGVLDFVAGWYIKAAQYLAGSNAALAEERKKAFKDAAFSKAKQVSMLDEPDPAAVAEQAAKQSLEDIFALAERQDLAAREKIKVAFVSTNSICQGEQVGLLWSWMKSQAIAIEFAHRTFRWSNEASGKAAVHCVIVGFGLQSRVSQVSPKRLFDYVDELGNEDASGEPHESAARQINPYLVDAPMVAIESRKLPISEAPAINYGSFALDDGHFTLDEEARALVLADGEAASRFVRPFIGGQELLNAQSRWCLWLSDVEPSEIAQYPEIVRRVAAVKKWRASSSRATTVKLAQTPMEFAEIRQPESSYIAIPTVSSERRAVIPMAFVSSDTVASNQLYVIPKASLYHFAILTSAMHMAWVRYTCGRLKSDYRYSAAIVYNNFPWPELGDGKAKERALREAIELAAQAVLDVRAGHQKGKQAKSLAQLYDPDLMPSDLKAAHLALDKLIDKAYGLSIRAKDDSAPSADAQRVALLFERYQALVNQLEAKAPTSASATAAASSTVSQPQFEERKRIVAQLKEMHKTMPVTKPVTKDEMSRY